MKSKPRTPSAAVPVAEQELLTNAECEKLATDTWDTIQGVRALLQLRPYQQIDEAKRYPKMTPSEFQTLKRTLQEMTESYAATLLFLGLPEEKATATKPAKKPKKAAA